MGPGAAKSTGRDGRTDPVARSVAAFGEERPMVMNWYDIGHGHGSKWASFMTTDAAAVSQEVATRTADKLVRDYVRKGIDCSGKESFIRGFMDAVRESRDDKSGTSGRLDAR